MLKILFSWGYKLLLIIWLLTLLLVGIAFAKKNTQMLEVDLIFYLLPQMSSGLVISLALALGVIVGGMTFIPAWLIGKAKLRRCKLKLAKAEKRVIDNPLADSRAVLTDNR